MTTSFRKPFKVIKREMGYWQEGVYHPSDNVGIEQQVMATVQQPSTGDMMKIEMMPWGKRAARYIKIYTDTRLRCVNQQIEGMRKTYPGDIFCYDGSQYLLFGESDFTMLSQTRQTQVSHWRYYACELIEGFGMENVA
jgi:hypothetical protein